MFVAEGAKKTLVKQRKKAFVDNYVTGLIQEAEKLGITEDEIIELIKSTKGREA